MTSEDLFVRIQGLVAKQGEDTRSDIATMRKDLVQQIMESERRGATRFTNFAAEYNKKLKEVTEVSETARRRVSDISELAAQTKEHQSSSDLDSEARHAALIEQRAKKDLATNQKIAELDAKFEALTASKKGGHPISLAQIQEGGRFRTGIAIFTALAIGVIEVYRAAVPSASARQPAPMQFQGRP